MSQPYPAAFRRRLLLAASTSLMLAAGLCFAETTMNGSYTVTGNWNTGDANRTRVCKVAAADPGTCTVGDCYYNTAAAAGHNWKLCTTTNVWTEIVGSGAAMGFVTASGSPGANDIPRFTSATDIAPSDLDDDGTNIVTKRGTFRDANTALGFVFDWNPAVSNSTTMSVRKNGVAQLTVDSDGHFLMNPISATAGNNSALFDISAPTEAGVTTEKPGLRSRGGTLTLTGTYGTQRFNRFGIASITAASPFTVTDAATVAIEGAPTQAGSATVTNKYSLWVQGGESRLAGNLGIDPGADSTAEYKIVADPDGVCNQNNVLMYTAATGGITCQPISLTGTQCIPQVAADGSLESSTLCHLTSSGIDTFQLGGTGALSVVPGSAATILGTCGLPWPKMWVSELDATSTMLFKTSTAAECTQSTRMTLSGGTTNAAMTFENNTDITLNTGSSINMLNGNFAKVGGGGGMESTREVVIRSDYDNNNDLEEIDFDTNGDATNELQFRGDGWIVQRGAMKLQADSNVDGTGAEIDLDTNGDETSDWVVTQYNFSPAADLSKNIGDATHRVGVIFGNQFFTSDVNFEVYTNNATAVDTPRFVIDSNADQATATFTQTDIVMSTSSSLIATDKLHLVSGFAAGGGAAAAIDATATEDLGSGDIVFGVYDNTAGGPDTLMTVDGAGGMVLLRDFSARDITASSNFFGTWQGTTIAATKGGTGLSTVTTGDLLYGSAANTWSALADVATGNVLKSGGVGVAPAWGNLGALYTLTSDDTDANSTTKTDLTNAGGIGSKVLPANYFTAGKTIRVVARGRYGTALVPGNITLDFDLVSSTPTTVTVATTGSVAAPAVSLTNQYFECSLLLTCRTTGAAGTVQSQGICNFSTAAGTSLGYEMVETGTRTVNTTLTEEVKFSMTWATANAANTITVSNATVEALN